MPSPISVKDLNPPQREAVTTLSGPMLVLAGAGTGKTRVVTYRIANLIQHGTKPDRILAVTFTNKAANEMKDRVSALLGTTRPKYPPKKKQEDSGDAPEPQVSTFHSLCVKILRRHIDKIGYPQNFSICDRGDQESVARQALREIKVPDKMLKPSELLGFISRWKSASVRPADAGQLAADDKEHIAAVGYRRYQEALKTGGAVDFDDLLLCTEDLFRKSAEARRAEARLFDHILIDEYQDTNQSQYRIIKALAAGHRNLCVVGDDDQSIYGWRGAEVKHILRFDRDWPNAKVIRLEDNYRSTGEILEWANTLIAFNKTRHGKVLKPARFGGEKPRIMQFQAETDEAEQIALEIRRLIDTKKHEAGEIAILFRTNEQPRIFEEELRRQDIPYVLIGGMSFFDRREIKDVLSLLQVIANPDNDPALRRIINVPPRGISRPAVQAIAEAATSRGISPWKMLADTNSIKGLSTPAIKGCNAFRALIEKYQQSFKKGSLTETLRSLLDEINFLVELRSRCNTPEEAQSREASVEQIVNSMSVYESKKRKSTLTGFLDEIALSNRELESDKEKQLNKNRVVLMTMHSAKGLEFPRVYIVGMEEGILPHHRSIKDDGPSDQIEEERRLCYVGVTRAEDYLTLSLALSRRKWGKPQQTDASRFLFELTGQAEKFVPNRAAKSAKARLATARRKSGAAAKYGNKTGGKTGGKARTKSSAKSSARPKASTKTTTKSTTKATGTRRRAAKKAPGRPKEQ